MSKASLEQIHTWRNPPDDIIGLTDGYKIGHWLQYRPGTTGIFSYQESRGGRFPEATFFGLQYFIKRYMAGQVVTEEAIQRRKAQFSRYLNNPTMFNEEGWRYILKKHQGRLPVIIKAVPEGTTIPVSNAFWTIENTDKKNCAWLTNYLETLLSITWYPTTVATQCREMKKVIVRYLKETGGDPALADLMLVDFGFRGSTSPESAGIGGLGHLVSFQASDNIRALDFAEWYYHEALAAGTIFAAEHSTITSWGRSREADSYENILDLFKKGNIAIVGDSYDVYNACRDLFGNKLREKILARHGALFVRPDSGYPPKMVVEILEILAERFGYTVRNGYKILNPKVRLIQGDGIDYWMVEKIYEAMKQAGFAAENVFLGSGGGILQKVDRDTQKEAVKCSAVQVDGGEWEDVKKDPITDTGKKSKAGRLVLVQEDGVYSTIRECEAKKRGLKNELITTLENGELCADYSLAEIRGLATVD